MSTDVDGAAACGFHVNGSGVVVLHDSNDAAITETTTPGMAKARMADNSEGTATATSSAGGPRSDRPHDTSNTGGRPRRRHLECELWAQQAR